MKKRVIIITAAIAGLVLIVIAGFFIFFSFSRVPSGAMANTILPEDRILSTTLYGEIKRGDIIIFKYPLDPSIVYVKRVVGLPGEKIQIVKNHVLINGHEMAEQIIMARMRLKPNNQFDTEAPMELVGKVTEPQNPLYTVYVQSVDEEDPVELRLIGQKYGVAEPLQIPADNFFLLGDNRQNSQDSRYWGPVPKSLILAKVLAIYRPARGEWISIK